jgi:hypothetical protein
MSNKITFSDYKSILSYYNIPIPSSKKLLKQRAHDILSEKLCKCIKQIPGNNEEKAIKICTKSIFDNKGLKRGTFKCKGKKNISFKKIKKMKLLDKQTKKMR